jgi:methylmalonyl-CoA mutase C-terminal domain/subunit
MNAERKVKIVVSMIGLDGHTTGGEVVAHILRDAGFEVVYLGVYQTPEMIVKAAIQEDVDAIGISSHASNYDQIVEVVDLLRTKNMNHILVFCGGTIPRHQIPQLKEKGVVEVFTPNSSSASMVDCIVSEIEKANAGARKVG